ncbi:MAG: type IV pilus assembly protein PilM [Planctomycetes bacterium]|nr:type IV pilus assembly protein PilM [Planctomycetota bacterium]
MARQRSILGLDVGTYSVKAVELTGIGDDVRVTGLGWERIPSPDMVEDTIHAVLANNNLRARRVVTSVSGRSVIVRHVTMMPMPPEELRQAVRYEADKYIPYDVDDVQLDCQQLGPADEAGSQIRVLLVAAKRQLIEEHIGMLKRVDLQPAMIDVDLFALANAFELCNARAELAAEGEAVALVDIGASKTSICVMKGMADCFTREVYTAGNAMTDAVAKRFGESPTAVEGMKEDPGEAISSMSDAMLPVIDDLGSEVRLSFDYYENQFEQTVSKVYVSGGSIMFPPMLDALKNSFELETNRFNPFETVNVEVADDVIIHEKASDMVVAFGLASRLRGM